MSLEQNDDFATNSVEPVLKKIKTEQNVTSKFVLADSTNGIYKLLNAKAQVVITSPPYYGARDYETEEKNKLGTHTTTNGGALQLGHEETPYAYARRLAKTFENGSWFLTDHGSLFVVIGDTFARRNYSDEKKEHADIKKGECIGIFGIFVFEMRRKGWMLWQEIVWSKPSVPPSGASQVRCTPSSERILWFCLNYKPLFDNKAIREEGKTKAGTIMPPVGGKKYGDGKEKTLISDGKRCRRDVWEICPSRDKSAHVAPFPEELVELMILACSEENDTIVDPFAGTLTVQRVANRLKRSCISFDIINHTQSVVSNANEASTISLQTTLERRNNEE